MNYYIFTVIYFDEIDRLEKTVSGFAFGSDISEALIQLADYYGDDCLNEVKLTYLGEHRPNMIVIPDNIINNSNFENAIRRVNFW